MLGLTRKTFPHALYSSIVSVSHQQTPSPRAPTSLQYISTDVDFLLTRASISCRYSHCNTAGYSPFLPLLSNKGLNNTSSTPSHDLCGPLAVLMIPGFICKHFGNAATKLTDNTHLRRQKLGELRDLVYIQHAILTHYSSLHFGFMGWLCVNCLFNVDIFLHSF